MGTKIGVRVDVGELSSPLGVDIGDVGELSSPLGGDVGELGEPPLWVDVGEPLLCVGDPLRPAADIWTNMSYYHNTVRCDNRIEYISTLKYVFSFRYLVSMLMTRHTYTMEISKHTLLTPIQYREYRRIQNEG